MVERLACGLRAGALPGESQRAGAAARSAGTGGRLEFCPKCLENLQPGKHHIGCSASASAPRDGKRARRKVRCHPRPSLSISTSRRRSPMTCLRFCRLLSSRRCSYHRMQLVAVAPIPATMFVPALGSLL